METELLTTIKEVALTIFAGLVLYGFYNAALAAL